MKYLFRSSLALSLLASVLFGCTPLRPLSIPSLQEADIYIKVVATGKCGINLPSANNACKGVGDSDGLACGRPGDTVRWVPNNSNTEIRSIEFSAGDNVVCDGGVTGNNQGRQCVLKEPAGMTDERGYAYKYEIGVNFRAEECAKLDPYVIITSR